MVSADFREESRSGRRLLCDGRQVLHEDKGKTELIRQGGQEAHQGVEASSGCAYADDGEGVFRGCRVRAYLSIPWNLRQKLMYTGVTGNGSAALLTT